MEVWTPKGVSKVVRIVATPVVEKEMCHLGKLVVTPWHSISVDDQWIYPNDIEEPTLTYTGIIY